MFTGEKDQWLRAIMGLYACILLQYITVEMCLNVTSYRGLLALDLHHLVLEGHGR